MKNTMNMKNKKILRACLLSGSFTLLLWGGYLLLERFFPKAHYYAQFLAFGGWIALVLFLRAFGRLFRSGPLWGRMTRTLRRITARIGKTLSAFGEKLGKVFGEGSRKRLHGTDERSFVRREPRKNDTSSRRRDRLRWSELTSNRDRLRFIYVRFIRQGGKRGYRYHPAKTPQENGRLWSFPAGTPEEKLFASYTDARFAPEGERLDDGELAVFAELVGKKTKG